MKRFDTGFPSLLEDFSLKTLEGHPHSTYALSPELCLIYLNPAWFRFAAENGGEPEISERFCIGTQVCGAISQPLREFYRGVYARILMSGQLWQHDYECSSAEVYRRYHQTVYSLRKRAGLLVVNSLVRELPHNSETHHASPPDEGRYAGLGGLITQCCHCRRVQRIAEPDVWDWVPAWVERMPFNTTGGLCPVCYEYYWKLRAKAG
jgi:hypothetical protein